MIKSAFINSVKNYNAKQEVIQFYWSEIEKAYTKSDRHYHNLTHLENLLQELEPFKEKFANWDEIVFAIAYHDIVYNTLKSNNEEESATLAVKRLSAIDVPDWIVKNCQSIILATKKHEEAEEPTSLFTDADLSILGAEENSYKQYTQQIRKEYKIYPDLIYNPGRKKVLNHFLNMERIFKTKEFGLKYEHQARLNLTEELDSLK